MQREEFWLQSPIAGLAVAELKFKVASIAGERERFAHALGAMGFSVVRGVMDLIWWQNTPALDPSSLHCAEGPLTDAGAA